MTADQAQKLVDRARQRLRTATLTKGTLLVAAALALGGFGRGVFAAPDADFVVLMGVGATWLALAMRASRSLRQIASAGHMAGSGRIDLAASALAAVATEFAAFRGPRLLALQNLAALAHAAGRFGAAARISEWLVRHGRSSAKGFEVRNRLVLADSVLMLGNLSGAYDQLQWLHAADLTEADQFAVLPTACYYEVAVGRWDCLAAAAKARAARAVLLPAPQAAATLGCLALGMQNLQRPDCRDWLWTQALLLIDRDAVVSRFPLLAPLPAGPAWSFPWESECPAPGEQA